MWKASAECRVYSYMPVWSRVYWDLGRGCYDATKRLQFGGCIVGALKTNWVWIMGSNLTTFSPSPFSFLDQAVDITRLGACKGSYSGGCFIAFRAFTLAGLLDAFGRKSPFPYSTCVFWWMASMELHSRKPYLSILRCSYWFYCWTVLTRWYFRNLNGELLQCD